MRRTLILIAALLASPALAYDAAKAPKYGSPDQYRPHADDVVLHGGPFTGGVSLDSILALLRPEAASNAALKTSGTWFNKIHRAGFLTAGDGGAMDYNWSPTNCAAADDGAQVQPTGRTGCWIADIPSTAVDVRLWGARISQNIDDPLDKAIAYACKTSVPLVLPFPIGGYQYQVATSHKFGNGSKTQLSTCNNISFSLTEPFGDATSGTTPPIYLPFRYTGTDPNVIPFVAQGPASAIKLKGIGVDCVNVCKTGIKLDNIMNGDFGWFSVQGHVGPAIVVTSTVGNTWQGAMEGSRMHDWWLAVPGPGGSGMDVGDTTCTACDYAVISNIWDNITINYDATSPTAYGIKLGLASLNTFNRFRVTRDPVRGGSLGRPLVIAPPPGDHGWPTANHFDGALFEGIADPGPDATGWAPYAGQGITFTDHSILSAPFPVATTVGNYTGTDSAGNRYPAATAWTPTDGSGAGLALTVQHATYTKRGKECVVDISITYPATADARAAVIGNLPCKVKSDGISHFGAVIAYTDIGSPFSILAGDSTFGANFYYWTGQPMANANLSGKSFRGTVVYRTN